MRIPFYPLQIDSFSQCDGVRAHILSHFHTDHMSGLAASWRGGTIYTTSTTRALLRERFGEAFVAGSPSTPSSPGLAVSAQSQHALTTEPSTARRIASAASTGPRVVAVPFEVPVWIPLSGGPVVQGTAAEASDIARYCVQAVFIPANHIPGSAMILFPRLAQGSTLYTGDFKFDPATAAGETLVESLRFWLRFGEGGSEHQGAPLSLTQQRRQDDLADATLLDALAAQSQPQSQDLRAGSKRPRETQDNSDERQPTVEQLILDDTWLHLSLVTIPGVGHDGPARARLSSKLLTPQQLHDAFTSLRELVRGHIPRAPCGGGAHPARFAARPFVLRCYVHNNFGKEVTVVSLARLLGTTIVIDDLRYRLLGAAADPSSPDLECDPACEALDMQYFTSASCFAEATEAYLRGDDRRIFFPDESAGPLLPPGCVEIVGVRASIDPATLRADEAASVAANAAAASAANDAAIIPVPQTAYYGIVMSGWARLSKKSERTARVIDIPYSLHTSPECIIDFVQMLRPRGITQLFGRESRASGIVSMLGPHLREPFRNAPPEVPPGAALPLGFAPSRALLNPASSASLSALSLSRRSQNHPNTPLQSLQQPSSVFARRQSCGPQIRIVGDAASDTSSDPGQGNPPVAEAPPPETVDDDAEASPEQEFLTYLDFC